MDLSIYLLTYLTYWRRSGLYCSRPAHVVCAWAAERSGPVITWYARFMTSTRGRLLSLLRRQAHTVEELAQRLGLSDNAVRAHLATLERDGLVEQRGVRRDGGVGK